MKILNQILKIFLFFILPMFILLLESAIVLLFLSGYIKFFDLGFCILIVILLFFTVAYGNLFLFLFMRKFYPNKLVHVVSWAENGCVPDLDDGRWVLIGRKNKFNFMRILSPYFDANRKAKRDFNNCAEGEVTYAQLKINNNVPLAIFVGHLQITKKELRQ